MTREKSNMELLAEQLKQMQLGNLDCVFSGTTTGRMKAMSVVHAVNHEQGLQIRARPANVESVFSFLQEHVSGKETIDYVENLELLREENSEAFMAATQLRSALQLAVGVADRVLRITGFDEKGLCDWRPQVEAALRLTFHK